MAQAKEQTKESKGSVDVQRHESGLQRSSRPRGLSRRDPFESFNFGPFALMRRMQEDMDRLFGGGFGRDVFGGGPDVGEWAPAIEVFQRGNDLVVRADVPGLSREDLSVEVGDDALTIRGERKYDHQEEQGGVFRSERSYGTFYRVVPLPEGVMTDSAKATFKDGVLEVIMQAPPHEVRRGRQIEIGEGGRTTHERQQGSGQQK